MKANLKTAVAVALLTLLAACDSGPTLDTTNSDTLRESRTALMAKLTDAERGQVYRAIDQIEKHEILKQLKAGKNNFAALTLAADATKKRVHGMTAKKLIKEGAEAEEDRQKMLKDMRG